MFCVSFTIAAKISRALVRCWLAIVSVSACQSILEQCGRVNAYNGPTLSNHAFIVAISSFYIPIADILSEIPSRSSIRRLCHNDARSNYEKTNRRRREIYTLSNAALFL